MGTLSFLFPICFSASLKPKNNSSSITHLNEHSSCPNIYLKSLNCGRSRGKRSIVYGGKPSERNGSQFFDENGVVDDMDGYLNYLSLEYDSVWDTKPSWCQPWTIALTGVLAIACSWLVFQSAAVTSIVLFLVCGWWYIFLYSYPKAYKDMIAERRKRVTSGLEDTYGAKKIQ